MKSRSSRRKSDSKVTREVADRLLRSGTTIRAPNPDVTTVADHLASKGLIDFEIVQVVLCANPEDGDFGRGNRNCAGRIIVPDGYEDSNADLFCPDCGRRIFPDSHSKRRHDELHAEVCREGVMKYCGSLLSEIDPGVKSISDGTFRMDVQGTEVFTCLIDFLIDGIYWSQQWAALNPVCYVAVNPDHVRFSGGDWLTKVSLAELVCGEIELQSVLQTVALQGRPRNVPQASVALFGKGPAHTVVEPECPTPTGRQFLVEVGPNIVRVDGETVVPSNAGPRFLVFRTLWQWFLDDLRAGRAPAEFRAWSIDKIAEDLVSQTKDGVADDNNTRRLVNNLQSGIAETLKRKNGTPIGRNDLVESCPGGYRINPFTVVVRPFQPDLS